MTPAPAGRMPRNARLLTLAAALLLGVLYVTPLWSVRLVAPQYPEGLGMNIRVNTVEGVKEHDLQNINSLNHYIGMKEIRPEMFPELQYMPWILGALIAGGLAVAAAGRRRLLVAWLSTLAIGGGAGLYDFQRWNYDYGHNLDFENAILVIPDMSYQPPLIGSKQIANFTATSYPAAGALLAGFAFAAGAVALFISCRRRRNPVAFDRPASSSWVPVTCAGTLMLLSVLAVPAGAQRTIVVRPGSAPTIAEAVRGARSGDRIAIMPGVYRERTIVVDRPLTISGEPGAVLDGANATHILSIEADDVTIRGLSFRNVGISHVEDRAAIRVGQVRGCRIEKNSITAAFFGIYLAGTTGCRISQNELRAFGTSEDRSGNGIHLWTAREIEVLDNRISGHRDGIYLEFAHGTRVAGNLVENNVRYGLHFMYSDDCVYERNIFRANHAGVAVMYTKRVTIAGNRFEDNWGPASFGLLLKEIYDSRIEGNRFVRNTTGIVADGATRMIAANNLIADNGWGVRLMASTQDAELTGNSFLRNTFDVSTNSRQSSSTLRGNYWDQYQGYDLDRDGHGDVPHRPVRLFSLIVERHKPALVLLRSPLVAVLDRAERVLPTLTPGALADTAPLMRRPSDD